MVWRGTIAQQPLCAWLGYERRLGYRFAAMRWSTNTSDIDVVEGVHGAMPRSRSIFTVTKSKTSPRFYTGGK